MSQISLTITKLLCFMCKSREKFLKRMFKRILNLYSQNFLILCSDILMAYSVSFSYKMGEKVPFSYLKISLTTFLSKFFYLKILIFLWYSNFSRKKRKALCGQCTVSAMRFFQRKFDADWSKIKLSAIFQVGPILKIAFRRGT